MFRKMFECGCNWLRIRAYVEVDDAPCLVGVMSLVRRVVLISLMFRFILFDVPFHVFKRLNMSSWKTRYLVLKLSNVELSLGLDA